MAVMAASPLLFDLLEEVTPDNASGEFYLTDIVEIATAEALAVTYRTTDEHEIAGVNCRQDLGLHRGHFAKPPSQ